MVASMMSGEECRAKARQSLELAKQMPKAELQAELEALFNAQNASSNEDVTSIPATFLRVTVAV